MFFHLHFTQLFRGAAFVICAAFFALTANAATQTDIAGPTGSNQFGTRIYNLPNGNIVVTDPGYSTSTMSGVGAVRLYNGATNALISTLTGSKANDNVGSFGITILTNGNYVVSSPNWSNGSLGSAGAATYCDAATGVNGVVSTANSLVGGATTDRVSYGNGNVGSGVISLTNGNYVVRNYTRNNGAATQAGIVTFVNSATGTVGTANNANSLVGTTANDVVGFNVYPLTNGNYVVASPNWDSGSITDVGAVTFGDGTTGVSGAVSASNSLVGSKTGDMVGSAIGTNEPGVVALTNGNYVVRAYNWDNGTLAQAGAVTFGNGTTGVSGTISAANSLVGSAGNDGVGSSIVALPNGNYVVISPFCAVPFFQSGAVTFGNGVSGISGTISASNSLVGNQQDSVGYGGITVLTNGNYVVKSYNWKNGSATSAGAVTWASGTTGITGTVSAANSLVGTKTGDMVGYGNGTGGLTGVTPLANGNYVVSSYAWDNGSITDAGAVTFCNGATGTSGAVSATNSLVGGKANDQIGGGGNFTGGVTALANGNYVVRNPSWDNGAIVDAGAVTFANGTSGISGLVSASNSLVGSQTSDFVGTGANAVTVLTNGNYVVRSTLWDNGAIADAGAVTFGSGVSGTVGAISATNSLVGSTASDQIGGGTGGGVTALTNGNYVVSSPLWDNGAISDAAAVTFGNGTNGIVGTISAANSLTGQTSDSIGSGGITALPNGNYIVRSPLWDNVSANVGAITYGAGNGGTVGAITPINSVRGAAQGYGSLLIFAFEPVNEQLVVGRPGNNSGIPGTNIVSLFRPTHTAIVDGNSSLAATWDYGAFNRTGDVVVPSSRSVTLNHNFTANSLTVPAGGSVSTNNNRLLTLNTVTLDGFLNLAGGGFDTNGGTINTGSSGTISGADSSNYITRSTVQRTLTAGDSYTFDVGTMSGYAPVTFSNITGSGQVTVTPQQGTYPNTATGLPANRLARWWTLANPGGGITQTNITFGYQPSDVSGTERNYFVYRIPTGGGAATQIAGGINAVKHLINASNVTGFSDWTAADSGMPTAAGVAISGRVATIDGRGINNVRITLTDMHGQSRTISTGSFGYYRFENVAAGRDYIISVAAKRYSFNEPSRLLSVTSALDGINFTPLDNYSGK